MAIANHYPFNGFQSRYKSVYEDALQAQTQWLTETNAPSIQLDPRSLDKETLSKSYLEMQGIMQMLVLMTDKKRLKIIEKVASYFRTTF